jgi:hypothetical protein
MACQNVRNQCERAAHEQRWSCEAWCNPRDPGCAERCNGEFANDLSCCDEHTTACDTNQAQPGCTVGGFPANTLNYGQIYSQAANPSSRKWAMRKPDCILAADLKRNACLNDNCMRGSRACIDTCNLERLLDIGCCASSGSLCDTRTQPTNTVNRYVQPTNLEPIKNRSHSKMSCSQRPCYRAAMDERQDCFDVCEDLNDTGECADMCDARYYQAVRCCDEQEYACDQRLPPPACTFSRNPARRHVQLANQTKLYAQDSHTCPVCHRAV